MQTIAGYPTNLTSSKPTVTVSLNGTPRKVASVNVTRELPSELPEQVSGGSGIVAATGEVVWSTEEVSRSKRVTPWGSGAFPPRTWETITVDSGYGGVEARLLTGQVRGGSGSLSSRFVSSAVIDSIHMLNQPVSIQPLLKDMPPLNSGGDYRYIGITPTYFTDRILRACGFYSTPAQENGCVFSAPLMGSAWPERGLCVSSSAADTLGSPSWVEAPWGQSAFSLDASYTGAFTPAYDGRLNQTMQMSLVVDRSYAFAGTASGTFTTWWDADYVRIGISSTGAIIALKRVGGVESEVCRLTIGSGRVFTLRVTPAGVWTIVSSDGRTISGTSALSSGMTSTPFTSVQVRSGHQAAYPIGGAQVAFTSVYTAINHARNTSLTPAAYRFSLDASPAIENRNALELLKEQAAAECAAMWLNEYGTFTWVNRDLLTPAGPVSESITPSTKMVDLDWEHNWGSVRSKVIINYRLPTTAKASKWVNDLAFRGGGDSMESGQEKVEFITPGSDEDWIIIDETPERIGDAGTTSPFNRGQGSFYGGTVTDGDTLDRLASPSELTVTVQRLGVSTLKVTTQVGTLPAGTTLELRMPDSVTGIWPQHSRANLPVFHANRLLQWTGQSKTGANFGPVNAPVLEHDTGWWVHPDGIQALADWLSAQVSQPHPVIRSLDVLPDDRRQLADIVQVEFDLVSLRCLVVAINDTTSMSGQAISKSQKLSLRVISANSGETYNDLDAAYGYATYNQFDSAWGAETYNELDSDPLQKA
ncbi:MULTISPECIES: hypothetical protein [unclassified Arthrobacter]|uniref:hypothetical protein n=1 Tax=unclassified Arthrobacter TaxID=235627 RepID=UPI0014920C72|nr:MULTISPECIES: hypothetical protein [unclassified Arthrobacter]MBE0009605.1 hypothetical protein [Arthrobacter sp. AET 35A]NOJ63356.1 hypothetical protein [Arthrobacter sp. 147(2020)]